MNPDEQETALEAVTDALAKLPPALNRIRRLNTWIWIILAAACVINTLHCLIVGAQVRELRQTVARLTVNP